MAVIVVGVDGTEASKGTLLWALEEATLRNASVRVVHAARDRTKERIDRLDDIVRKTAEKRPEAEIAVAIVEGNAASVLIAESEGAELLVVGSRPRSGVTGLLPGSVGDQCARHAKCPVAIVRRGVEGHEQGEIVVGVDGSWASKTVLRFAIEEAVLRQSSVHVVHAWRYATGGLYTYGTARRWRPAEDSSMRRARTEQDRLEKLVRALVPDARVQLTQSAVEGDPAHVLLEAAHDAQLLVVGSRSDGGVASPPLGSVGQQCAHHAPCPVLVVRPLGTPHRLTWPEV